MPKTLSQAHMARRIRSYRGAANRTDRTPEQRAHSEHMGHMVELMLASSKQRKRSKTMKGVWRRRRRAQMGMTTNNETQVGLEPESL